MDIIIITLIHKKSEKKILSKNSSSVDLKQQQSQSVFKHIDWPVIDYVINLILKLFRAKRIFADLFSLPSLSI